MMHFTENLEGSKRVICYSPSMASTQLELTNTKRGHNSMAFHIPVILQAATIILGQTAASFVGIFPPAMSMFYSHLKKTHKDDST